jgi:hypothetical protein
MSHKDYMEDFVNWDDLLPHKPTPSIMTIASGAIWRTREGQLMLISDMETSHIVNTIAYLWRVGTLEQLANDGRIIPFYQNKIHQLTEELLRRMKS